MTIRVGRALSLMVLALPLMAFECSFGGQKEEGTGNKSARQQCIDRVRRDYPVPPGNVNEQNQMIRDECGGS